MSTPHLGPLLSPRILADADLCVKCGLCLPHCPTYLDSQHEGDSPRGRIALIQALGSSLIPQNATLERHLDGCLSCRKCEVVCPAKVPYSRVLDAGRAQLAVARPARTRMTRLLAALLVPRSARMLLRAGFALYRGLGVQKLVRRYGSLGRDRIARLESLLPVHGIRAFQSEVSRPAPFQHQAEALPALALFRGCVTDLFERDALDATETLLRAAGYEVQSSPGQTCCGALHQHGGMPDAARRLAQKNIAAFSAQAGVASCTTGCAATLHDYGDFGLEGGTALARKVKDFADWLLPRIERLHFRPLPLRAALHLPCTACNVMKSDVALRALLRRVPQLKLIELDPAQHCCGAAGSHFITHPEAADRLLARKLDALERLQPDLVLSANIGCTLHLAGGLRRAGRALPAVRHPAVLLAEQLLPALPAA